jgi:low affinity Fe/Cu permease
MRISEFLIAFFLSLIFFADIALAQDVIGTIWSLVYPYIGIIFIIIFVIVLLIIGGVWRPSFGGSFASIIIFIIAIAILFFLPQFITFPDYMKVVPASFKYWELPGPAKDAMQLIGLPREWGYIPAIIYLFILPFTAIFALFWAFLDTLGIIPQANVKRILALIVAFMTIPMGYFVKMVWVLFAFMGMWSVVVFAAIFILGIFFRGAGIVAREYSVFKTFSGLKKDADKVEEYADKLIQKARDKAMPEAVAGLESAKEQLVRQVASGGISRKAAETQLKKLASEYKL